MTGALSNAAAQLAGTAIMDTVINKQYAVFAGGYNSGGYVRDINAFCIDMPYTVNSNTITNIAARERLVAETIMDSSSK